jgi:hypothetical protein
MSNAKDIDIERRCQYFCLDVLVILNPEQILKMNAKCCLDGKTDVFQS